MDENKSIPPQSILLVDCDQLSEWMEKLPLKFPDDYIFEYTDLANGNRRLTITFKAPIFDNFTTGGAMLDLSFWKPYYMLAKIKNREEE